jgi:hypothetical protein
MRNNIKTLIRNLMPFGIIQRRRAILNNRYAIDIQKEKKIKNYFLGLNKAQSDIEIGKIIEYLDVFPFNVFPYIFNYKYNLNDVEVFYDKTCKMKYVLHCNKRLYFPENYTYNKIQYYYNSLLVEQDDDSPHRYETFEFAVQEGDVIVDIGAAEGIWALVNAEKAARIYLFECDSLWVKALEKTFEPFKDKVIFANKYISNVSIADENKITLDDFVCEDIYLKEKSIINFIKADIEGTEVDLLQGASKTLALQNNLKLLLCTYHRKNDADVCKQFLEKMGFTTEFSKGYMLFIHDPDLDEPYIRRGLIRAKK